MGSDLLHCVPYTTHLNTLYGRYHLSPIKTEDDERHVILYTLFCQPQRMMEICPSSPRRHNPPMPRYAEYQLPHDQRRSYRLMFEPPFFQLLWTRAEMYRARPSVKLGASLSYFHCFAKRKGAFNGCWLLYGTLVPTLPRSVK